MPYQRSTTQASISVTGEVSGEGTINVYVLDVSTSKPIAGVKVTAKTISPYITYTGITGSDGYYKFENVYLQTEIQFTGYSITAEKAGYKTDSEDVFIENAHPIGTVTLNLEPITVPPIPNWVPIAVGATVFAIVLVAVASGRKK